MKKNNGFAIAGLLIAVAGVAAVIALTSFAYNAIQEAIEECSKQDRVWHECLRDE